MLNENYILEFKMELSKKKSVDVIELCQSM